MGLLGDIAGATVAGGIAAAGSAGAAKINADASLASAREQMAFQVGMSETAYQRAVLDMKNAGLNPALAYTQGGASTPPGASYSANYGNFIGEGLSSALQTRMNKAQVKQTNQAALTARASEQLMNQQQTNAKADERRVRAEAEAAEAGAASAAQKHRLEEEFYSGSRGRLFYYIEKLLGNSVGGAIGGAIGGAAGSKATRPKPGKKPGATGGGQLGVNPPIKARKKKGSKK